MGRASRQKKAAQQEGKTRDHTVPQMYLRRFSEHLGPRQYKLTARRIDRPEEPFSATPRSVLAERGFYWGTTFEGTPHHGVEELFTALEGDAAKVFGTVLDAPEGALPERWPLTAAERSHLSWWIAAQILRTTRQRKRLTHLTTDGRRLETPAGIDAIAGNNPHLLYIVEHLASVAAALHVRPWGLGFSDMCLLTSDVPVVLFNHHDAENQVAAAATCAVLLPLDPHRLLFMPGPGMCAEDPYKRVDHRMKIDGGIGMLLDQVVYDVADSFVVHHPDHDPWVHWKPDGPRQPTPWSGQTHPAPEYVLDYGTIYPNQTVERRWLSEHPAPRTAPTA